MRFLKFARYRGKAKRGADSEMKPREGLLTTIFYASCGFLLVVLMITDIVEVFA